MIVNLPLHSLWRLFTDKFDQPGGYRFGYALKPGDTPYYALSVVCLRTQKVSRTRMLIEEPLASYKQSWVQSMVDLGYKPRGTQDDSTAKGQ